MLYLLSTANKQRPDKFDRVLKIQGRNRKYLARSKEEIEASGSSTQPRQIRGSPFWVMTNSPTPQNAAMLRDVLRILDYSKEGGRCCCNGDSLKQQVEDCTHMAQKEFSSAERQNIVKYLNHQYYRFQ